MADAAANASLFAPALLAVLMIAFVLFLAVLIGSFVLIRFFRRRRESINQATQKNKSEHVDAWLLHKLPEAQDEDE